MQDIVTFTDEEDIEKIPEVEFIFRDITEEELQELIKKRDAILIEMGYRPPDC